MDIRQLRYFVQIVESGSLTKASRQLFIAQSALSQRMALLEEEVGKTLLVRSVRGVVPTQNGDALYQHARFMLRQLDEAVLIARQEFSNVRGRVTVGLAPSTACMLGLPLLRTLKEKYPGILLNVFSALPGHLEEKARLGELDVAILFSKTAASEMTFEPLLDEEVFVILPGNTKLVAPRKKSLTLKETAALPMVLSTPSHALARRFMLELERAGLEPNVAAEIDSLLLVMRYVAEGEGATIQPMAATETLYPPDGWRCLPISNAPMTRANYIYALSPQKLSASASIVRAELKHITEQLIASGTWQGVRLTPTVAEAIGEDRQASQGLTPV
ncbi:LysR substrate-binding domain-containing protein [Rhodoferax sediminis]|uniref:LysR family transcriptional regulator n=1 Tax=Rhodoferax sediminis TaxID=2509614 RepID=A0A515DE48_9BURK|nr:LysR substrate-binding domain-containing protein [Rhodoferax sediminis]QDL38659.1 LysR family transcriptional regulator [Rhodoferax sediminis]